MFRRTFLAIILAMGLLLAFTVASRATGRAQPPICAPTYTVRSGDTLESIAPLLGISVTQLREANSDRLRGSDVLFADQVLCLPAGAVSLYIDGGARPPTTGLDSSRWTNPRFAIEVTYKFVPAPSEEEGQWNFNTSRTGYVGKRLVSSLQPNNSFRVITRTEQLRDAIFSQPTPALLAIRNADNVPTYTLAFVGNGPWPLASLLITPTAPIPLLPDTCNGAPVDQVLGGPQFSDVDVHLWLEGSDTLRLPMEISHISYMSDARAAYRCYNSKTIGLVLVPTPGAGLTAFANSGMFQALVLLQHNRYGPSGAVMSANCERWQGKRSPTYRLLRSLARCPR